MTFVTSLTLESGDRARLDALVDEIRETAERKGAHLKGPHTHPPRSVSVSRYKRMEDGGDGFESWDYTVYRRELSIVGHDELAREIATRGFPDGIRGEADVKRSSPMTN